MRNESDRSPATREAERAAFYGDAFYAEQFAESERSARAYVPWLLTWFEPQQVLDVGCGRGAWLKVFLEHGVGQAVGFDGPWNRAEHMADAKIEFRPIELDRSFAGFTRVDLAVTLEVAEHLTPASSDTFVKSLVASSDAVMFGAAYPGQGGTDHINERRHSEWALLFAAEGYDVFDLFRPRFWSDRDVCYWYRQNTFLYLKRGSDVHRRFRERGAEPLADLSFLDLVHPEQPPAWIAPPAIGGLMRALPSAIGRSVKYRMAGR